MNGKPFAQQHTNRRNAIFPNGCLKASPNARQSIWSKTAAARRITVAAMLPALILGLNACTLNPTAPQHTDKTSDSLQHSALDTFSGSLKTNGQTADTLPAGLPDPAAEIMLKLPELNVKAPDGAFRLRLGGGRILHSEVQNGRLVRFADIYSAQGKLLAHLPLAGGAADGWAQVYGENGVLRYRIRYRNGIRTAYETFRAD